jgi:hypothetical protein
MLGFKISESKIIIVGIDINIAAANKKRVISRSSG